MKVLVAGGAGFIGSHLIDALLREGHDVVCIDNFFIGTRRNIAHLKDQPHFTFYEQDLADLQSLRGVFEKEGFDAVFHLAANSDIQASASNPMIELNNTYLTTFNLLECMRLYEIKRLFFASTSAVYGERFGVPVSEDAPSLAPISYYGGAKLGAEAMISAYASMNDICALVFRFPNVIGPRLTHGVVFDFVNRLRQEPERLRILGDGRQSKPYIYVADLVEAIIRFMGMQNGGGGVTLYNVGVESQTTVTRIAQIVCEEMGLENVRFEYTGGRCGWRGDVPVFQYDLNKVHSAGWRAAHTSDEAVRLSARYAVSQQAGIDRA